MSLKISRTLKLSLIVFLSILMIASASYLGLYLTKPRYMEQIITTYEYSTNSGAVYQVILEPNSLFDSSVVGEGEVYITEFVDSIYTVFSHEIEGEDNAVILGNYEIVAITQGYSESENSKSNHQVIWEKKETLLPVTNFNAQSNTLNLEESATIKLGNYISYAKEFIRRSGVNLDVKLIVQMNVKYTLKVGEKIIEKTACPSLEIPLNTEYFTINKSNVGSDYGKIEEPITIQLEADKEVVRNSILFMALLMIALLYTIILPLNRRKRIFIGDLQNF